MCLSTDTASFLTAKDWLLLAVGAGFGCYASLIASRIIDFHTLRQTALNRAQLLSAIINKDSYDFKIGYTLDRMLQAHSVVAFSKGHKKAAEALRQLGDEVEAMFTVIRRSDDLWDITKKKNAILTRIAGIQMNLRAILWKGPSPSQVVDFYSQKEQEMVSNAREDRRRHGQVTKEYES